MSTEELLQAILDYPLLINLFAYDTYNLGSEYQKIQTVKESEFGATPKFSPGTILNPTNAQKIMLSNMLKLNALEVFQVEYSRQLAYPNAICYGVPTTMYNCHSYAWRNATNQQYWMDNPSAYWSDGSYKSASVSVGAKIIYAKNGVLTHSGIVNTLSSGSNKLIIIT